MYIPCVTELRLHSSAAHAASQYLLSLVVEVEFRISHYSNTQKVS